MSTTVLLTAAEDDAVEIKNLLDPVEIELLHFPLERYVPVDDQSDINETFDQLSQFENIIYSNLTNARYFMHQVEALDKMEAVRQRLNLTMDEETATFLEDSGVPAVCTYAGGKSINLVEFMLRLRRMGATLYPCGSHRKEDIPGFLEELDIPVKELELFDLMGPKNEELENYRNALSKKQPEVVIFHSRRSVNRTLAAFPDLDFESIRIISADKGISRKLSEKNIVVDDEAEGSWESISEIFNH